MNIKHLLVITGILLGAVAAGFSSCGDDSSNKVGGVDATKKLSDLTDSEAKSVCMALSSKIESVSTSVEAKVEMCLGSDAGSHTHDGDAGADSGSDCATAKADVAACTATVGEFNKCIDDYVAANVAALNAQSCSDLTSNDGFKDVAPPTTCTSLPAACQEIIGDDGDSNNQGGDGGV